MKRHVIALALGLIALFGREAEAAYPDKPVRIIVPYAAGGTSDILARLVGAKLTERLGQQFIVENRSGAGGNIGTGAAAASDPNGYTLLLGTINTHGINPSLYKDLTFDPVKDFAPITLIAFTPNVLSVHPSVNAKTLAEVIALAKAKPGALSFGSTSPGGSPHMSGELLKMMTGIDITHVPYRGGGPMLNDLIGGHIPLAFDNLPSSIGQIRAGAIRPIAVTSSKRWPTAPDIPTFAESGVDGYEVSAWFGLFAPGKTSPDIVSLLHKHISEILQLPDIRERLVGIGAEPVGNSPGEFATLITQEVEKWRKVVAATGAKIE